MTNFTLFAQPWWVNILMAIPLAAYYLWRKKGLAISKQTLIVAGLFGAAFGFVEASVVIYLRATAGLALGYGNALSDVAKLFTDIDQQNKILGALSESLIKIEFLREAATIIMLCSVAFLAAKRLSERCAIFLWTFAAWDIFYYAGLWAAVRWPSSLLTPDILFLIPVPWLSQVWFPILTSALSILAVTATIKNTPQ